jgi:hypothetical protein
MENLIRVVRNKGILIFGQNLTSKDAMQVPEEFIKSSRSEIGHPHAFSTADIFLPYFKGFKTVTHNVLKRGEGYAPSWNNGTLIYAGKKFLNAS